VQFKEVKLKDVKLNANNIGSIYNSQTKPIKEVNTPQIQYPPIKESNKES